MLINPTPSLGKKTIKEMLSVSFENDPVLHRSRPVVKINNSSLELIQTCKRKAYYALEQKLTTTEENSATLFGSGIHKALETWYSKPKAERTKRGESCVEPSEKVPSEHECARCLAISAYHESTLPLQTLDLVDKRHPYNGYKILNNYFDKYLDDPFEVYIDKEGPVVERTLETVLIDEPKLKVILFGTIDCVLQNSETKQIFVADHKTTSALGTDFYNRIRPNHQYTGYILLARKALGLATNAFIVNGIQVAKTKSDFARQITYRDENDFTELTSAIRWAVDDYLKARETNTWPMNSPNPCSLFGGCQYRSICETHPSLREQVIKNLYQTEAK